jgi:hypothetical protein
VGPKQDFIFSFETSSGIKVVGEDYTNYVSLYQQGFHVKVVYFTTTHIFTFLKGKVVCFFMMEVHSSRFLGHVGVHKTLK